MQGLSVWTWGPEMWKVMMLVAFQSDAGFLFPHLPVFFRTLGPLLPCRFCRESYPILLAETERELKLEAALSSKQMVRFVYMLHNKVNRKLALQRLENLKPFCNIIDKDAMLNVIDNHPSIEIVMKRNELFKEDPLNFEALSLILIVLLKRSDDFKNNFLLFFATVKMAIQNVKNDRYDDFARQLPAQKIKQSREQGLQELYDLFCVLFRCTPADIDEKLELMISGACVKGTCI
jgi:hypothetical protein